MAVRNSPHPERALKRAVEGLILSLAKEQDAYPSVPADSFTASMRERAFFLPLAARKGGECRGEGGLPRPVKNRKNFGITTLERSEGALSNHPKDRHGRVWLYALSCISSSRRRC